MIFVITGAVIAFALIVVFMLFMESPSPVVVVEPTYHPYEYTSSTVYTSAPVVYDDSIAEVLLAEAAIDVIEDVIATDTVYDAGYSDSAYDYSQSYDDSSSYDNSSYNSGGDW